MGNRGRRTAPNPLLLSPCSALNTVGVGWEEASSSPCSSPRLPAAGASLRSGVGLSARHAFDEMGKKAAGTREDPFRVLPDDLLDHILSFLSGDDALQSCVLDSQWRDLWRRKTSLHFILEDWSRSSRGRFNQLLKLIIHLKGDAPLTECRIDHSSDEDCIEFTEAKPLIEYVLKCRVEDLSICASEVEYVRLVLKERFVSRHLRTIEFGSVDLLCYSLDFSGCPVLEELTIDSCLVDSPKICSKSLQHLRFTGWCGFTNEDHSDIDAPRLISLELGICEQFTPFLEEMPLLEKASILLGRGCYNVCHADWGCRCSDKKCLLLNGLSNAVDLELIAEPKLNIFKRDLEWCPRFDRLKTLTLNEWFTAIDLFCILQHSPILEKLILQLGNTENIVGATGAQEAVEQPLVCAHLKFVYIECEEVVEGVCEFLNILSRCGIPSEQITIKEAPCPYSDYSSADSDSTDSD